LILEKKVESFFKHENILLTQAENGSNLNAYIGNQYIKTIPGIYYLYKRYDLGDKLILAGENSEGKKKYIFDYAKLDVHESKLSFVPKSVFNYDKLIDTNLGNISCYDILGSLIWKMDLSERSAWNEEDKKKQGKVLVSIIHGTSKTLVVSMLMFYVIGLDVETGKIKWEKKFPGGLNNIVIYKDHVFVMSYARSPIYLVLDVETGERALEVDLGEAWESMAARDPHTGKKTHFDWRLTSHTVDDKYMYITNRYDLEICIVNKYTAEIIERVPLEGGATVPALNAPIIKNNYLYQLDGNKNLFVFEIMG
jgi:hypothetical protein